MIFCNTSFLSNCEGCDDFWKRDVGSHHRKPEINGNIAATTCHLSETVKKYIVKSTEDIGEEFDKWRSDARVTAFTSASSTGPTMDLIGYFGSAENSVGEIPVTRLNGNGESKVCKTISRSIKFKKEDLRKLKVISQWDRKFIIAKLTADDFDESKEGVKGPKDILVVLDQHAIHERIRLERLISGNEN